MADVAALDGRPKVLLRRVKVTSGVIAVVSLVTFFTGPSILTIFWLALSILSFRATHERRASPKILKVFSCCAALSATCAIVAAIAVATLGGMLVSCACSEACTSQTWAVVLENQAHLNNVTAHLPPPETSSSTDVEPSAPVSASAPLSPSPTVVPEPAAPKSRRASLPSAFSMRPRFAADVPLGFRPRDFPDFPSPSFSSRVIVLRGRSNAAWHGLRVTSSASRLDDGSAPLRSPSSDASNFDVYDDSPPVPWPSPSSDASSFDGYDDSPFPAPPPPSALDGALDALFESARAWLDAAATLRGSSSDQVMPQPPPQQFQPISTPAFSEPSRGEPGSAAPVAVPMPAAPPMRMRMPMPMPLFPHAPRTGGRLLMRSLLGRDDDKEWRDKYAHGKKEGRGKGKHGEDDEDEDEHRGRDYENEDELRPASVGSSLLLDFAGGHRREVTERQFRDAADRVCESGGAVVAAVTLILIAVACFYAVASSSASRLAKHHWYIEAAALRRAARWGGGDGAFPPAIAAAAAGVPLPVAIAASQSASMPDERALYRFVPGRGFVPVTQAPASAAAPAPPAIPGDARPLRQELAAVLSSASAALSSMFRSGGRGYEAIPTAVELPPASAGPSVAAPSSMQMMRGQEPGGLSVPASAAPPPPPPPGSAQSYASVYAPSPYAQAPQSQQQQQQQWGVAVPSSPYSYGVQ